MADRTLTVDEQDKINASLAKAKAIAHVVGQVKPSDLLPSALADSMWALADLIEKAEAIVQGGKA